MTFDTQNAFRQAPALILGEDTPARQRIGQALSRSGFAIRHASELTEALKTLEHEPACLVFAIDDPGDPRLVEQIKRQAPRSEIILVTDHPSPDSGLDALCGVAGNAENETVTAPVPPETPADSEVKILRREKERLERINRVLMENSLQDHRTGLHNERFLLQMAECEIVRSRRYGRSFSLLFVDIELISGPGAEESEEYNLRLLQALASQLRSRLRRSDLLACYQDGVFGILLPETGRDGAYEVADALCSLIEKTWMLSFSDQTSMSLGIATYPENGEKASELFSHAVRQISH